jgi:hypothetical protein
MNQLARLLIIFFVLQGALTIVNQTEIVSGVYLNTGQVNNANTISVSSVFSNGAFAIFYMAGDLNNALHGALIGPDNKIYWSSGGLLGVNYITAPQWIIDLLSSALNLISTVLSIFMFLGGVLLILLQLLLNIFVCAPQFYTSLISIITSDTGVASTYGSFLGAVQIITIIILIATSNMFINSNSSTTKK